MEWLEKIHFRSVDTGACQAIVLGVAKSWSFCD